MHRLVAFTFIENDNSDRICVNHIDGDRNNNHKSNLEWCTHKENIKHARDNNLITDDNYVEYTLIDPNNKIEYKAFGYKEFLENTGVSDGVLGRAKNTNIPISRGKFKGYKIFVIRQPKGRKEI